MFKALRPRHFFRTQTVNIYVDKDEFSMIYLRVRSFSNKYIVFSPADMGGK